MALQDYTIYMLLRTIQWAGLFILLGVHTWKRQGQTRKLFQLTNAIALSVGLFAHRDFWLTLLSATNSNSVLLYVSFFFDDLAEAVLLGVLLLLSAGYCITNAAFTPAKRYAIFLPVVYFVSLVTTHFLVLSTNLQDEPDVNAAGDPSWTDFLFVFSALSMVFSLIVGWFTIFDNIERVKLSLQPEVANDPELGGQGGPEFVEGYVPAGAGAERPEVIDAATTIEEAVERARKVALVAQFRVAVTVYVALRGASIAIFVFGFNDDPLSSWFQALQNLLLWLFLAYLGWTFRLRADSPYLLLGEDEDDNLAFETHLDLGTSPLRDMGVEMSDQVGQPKAAGANGSRASDSRGPTSSGHAADHAPAAIRTTSQQMSPVHKRVTQTSEALRPQPAGAQQPPQAAKASAGNGVDATFTLDDSDEDA